MADYLEYIQEIKRNGAVLASLKLVELFERSVFTMCYRIIRNREEAEEVAQDVFLKCFKNLEQLDDGLKFPSWLMRIAYTSSIDHVRKRKLMTVSMDNVFEEINHAEKHPEASRIEHSDLFEKAFNRLNEDERAIINLYYQEDLPVKEISEITKLTAGNVKIRLFRARNKIRDYLIDHGMVRTSKGSLT